MSLPRITLMQADEVARPFHLDGWVYEEKYDGWRMVAYKDGTAVRLVSRAGKDHSQRFSELAAAIRTLPPATLILDGEVAIFDDKLISRFEWFRERPEDVASTPPLYMAFDCLYLDGRDLRRLPLRERRADLEQVLETDQALIFPVRRLAAHGLEAWRQVLERGYEVDGTAVRLISRAGKEHSRRFSELAAAIRALPPATLILDGEVAIFDDKLISRFEWFRKRPEDVASTSPIYMAFDCLYLEGRDLRPVPLRERRAELEAVVETTTR